MNLNPNNLLLNCCCPSILILAGILIAVMLIYYILKYALTILLLPVLLPLYYLAKGFAENINEEALKKLKEEKHGRKK